MPPGAGEGNPRAEDPLIDLDDLEATRTLLLEYLTERAFQKRAVTLASGRKSNFYIDCKQVTLDAEGHLLVGRMLFDAIERHMSASPNVVEAAGGLTLGADPIASAVAMTSALRKKPIPAFIVRKEPKGHGTGAYIEGLSRVEPGSEVVVLMSSSKAPGCAGISRRV